jgi:transketolase
MRNDFVRQLQVEMERDPRIMLLTGDLGFRAFEPVKEKFPDRFVNVGIAEANMIGVACGLALGGWKPFAYSIASFATMRCYEQIRTDVCYHGLDVKIVGAGGGFNYAHQGVTHHTIEDVAIMRVLPGMTVVCPSYSWEAGEATRLLAETPGPAYLKLGKSPGTAYQQPDFRFAIGKGFVIREGNEIVLVSTGNVLDVAMDAALRVESRTGKRVCVISMPTVKPLDRELILTKAASARAIFTIEEHSRIGGLGSAVAEVLVESDAPKQTFHPFGIPDHFIKAVGSREYLLREAGLDAERVANEIVARLEPAGLPV